MAKQQQYGLILTNKKQLSTPKAGNIFGNDDDSEDEEGTGTDWVKKALKAEHEKNKCRKQTRLNMQKALKEDPTIFQYDEVYDEIERTKEEELKAVKKVERKSKYINNLLKSAELRKKEQELRKDKQIQKEIEAEDAMFPDKERYVTSSYKAKLEEMKQFEEEQANRDRLEAIGDVTKQNDMSGFYRHLYRQTVEKNEADLGIVPVAKVTSEKSTKQELHPDIDQDDPIASDSESEGTEKSDGKDKKDISKTSALAKARQYRKRAQEKSESESESEPEPEKETKEPTKSTEKAEEESKSETVFPAKKQKLSDDAKEEKAPEIDKSSKDEAEKQTSEKDDKEDAEKDVKDKKEEGEKPKQEVKRKVNIWLKRTVGPVFEAALERYLIRKEQRLAGS